MTLDRVRWSWTPVGSTLKKSRVGRAVGENRRSEEADTSTVGIETRTCSLHCY